MPNVEPSVSFRNKVREALFKRKFLLKNKCYDQIFSLDKKSVAYPFVDNFGVKTPKVFFKSTKLEDIKLSTDLGSFVLKPEQSHSSLGVTLNYYDHEKNEYLELLSNNKVTFDDILKTSNEIMLEKKIANKWMVEELLLADDGDVYALDDWKFYTFYGEIGLILQKHKCLNGDIQYKLYDKDLNVVTNTGKYIGKINKELPIAKHIHQMMEDAKKLSSMIPRAYMRVDLFSTDQGVVFGEFTPFPGGFSMFWKAWDKYLGQLWLDAEARLELDMRSGKFKKLYDAIK